MALLRKDIVELLGEPPIFRLMATADLIGAEDQHLNPTWRGLVGLPESTEPSIPMAIKYLGASSVKISIELACGLAALALRLPVPRPALVYCDREDLPQLPIGAIGDVVLLFGSAFTPEDTIWARYKADTVYAEELIWRRVCSDPVGSKGAVWDELIANPDRHHHNLIFDGNWWLFDHDKAIPPATELGSAKLVKNFPGFVSKANILASEIIKRHPQGTTIERQRSEIEKHSSQLNALAEVVRQWKFHDFRLQGILSDSEILIRQIADRLPALALHVSNRLGKKDGDTLWT